MTNLKDLEENLKKKQYEKNIFDTLINGFNIGINELSKSIANILPTSESDKNKISKDIEDRELSIIKQREPKN